MEMLKFSSNGTSKLNQARLQLWCAKAVLAEANRTKDNDMKARAMSYINKDREALRKLARAIRAKLPAQDVYRVEMKGESKKRFAVMEFAHSQQQANRRVQAIYGEHFEVAIHV